MSIYHSVYLIILVSSCSQYNQAVADATQFKDPDHAYFRNLPCPNAEDIQPCVCNYHEGSGVMDMDCYDIADEQELFDVFNSTMPIPKFRRLHLDTSHLSTLLDTVFGDVIFEEAYAHDGRLTYVGPNTFMKSASVMRILYLPFNELSDFPFETLTHYKQLVYLSFSDNPISSFPIIKSKTLRYLDLVNTAYHSIPAAALEGLPNLEYLYAYNTDIDSMDNTYIDSMATGIFTSLPQLKILYMYNTGLTHLESQQFAVSSTVIECIDLGANQIATVDADAFTGVQSGTIDLRNNKLTILPEPTWSVVIDAGVKVKLKGNDLTCGCDVAWLVLEPLYHSQVDDAFCQSGEKLVELDPHIFDSC